ncbi:MAG: ATP-binding protein [Aquincola tertiaricarbonis]|uniref:ATP-binding protein n=1 Tax=Aquincola sp. J276 TaxID=2898432 RepID=UPI0021517C01|nr:ATP-binding protein [Aquincola sp. J276]MCR5866826.1 GAF domain-containing protein [Aquincola sp. J276]
MNAGAAAADACAREPIHIPGSIQPHGALLVVAPDGRRVLQASGNAAALLGLPEAPTSTAQIDGALPALLQSWAEASDGVLQQAQACGARLLQMTVHATPQGLIVELEPLDATELQTLDSLYPRLRSFLDDVEGEDDMAVLGEHAAREVRQLTGFDRVMVYRFDEEWHGTVIAEDGNGRLPSYLDLRFPASDIPAQARELYRRHRLRLIPDAMYTPVPVLPAASPLDGQPLDLSGAALRSVSPVHLQYMMNMGTAASMSVSIVIDGQLWGLIACHHAQPLRVGAPTRAACDFLGQILALKIGARERGQEAALRWAAKELEHDLVARMAEAGDAPDAVTGRLAKSPEAWLRLTRASGAAVLRGDTVHSVGQAPSPAQLKALATWLHQRQDRGELFATHALPAVYPPAAEFADTACGLIAAPISVIHPHYVMWFRPERIHTVTWGGRPEKATTADGSLTPRASFAAWTQEVRGTAQRWTPVEVDAARSFCQAMVTLVLKQAEQRAALTDRLETSNRELEAFSYSVSHDLRAPFRHIVGFAQLLGESEPQLASRSRHYLDTIIESALSAGRLVDDLLNFSQLGRASLEMAPVDMAKLVEEVRRSMRIDQGTRQVTWEIGPLPPAWGDASLLRQAWANLVDNAIKYTRRKPVAVIRISGEQRAHETVYTVSDNGVGFDMAYQGKLFGVFQRLHRVEDFEGSGIGLALTRRIIDRHGGWIAAEGAPDEGATFRFGVPRPAQKQGES